MKREERNIAGGDDDEEEEEVARQVVNMEEAREVDPLLSTRTATAAAPAAAAPSPATHRKVQTMFSLGADDQQQRRRRPKGSRHRRNKSSIGELLDSIREGIEQEQALLKGTFERELQDAADGKTYFLDMSMTRSLSVLPESLGDFAEEIGIYVEQEAAVAEAAAAAAAAAPAAEAEQEQQPSSYWWASILPYVGLLLAVLAVSSNGAALSMLDHVVPALKLYWRMTVTASVLLPVVVKTLMKEGGLPALSRSMWITFFGATVCFTGHALLLVTAFEYTSIGNAVIGANSQAILLILGKLVAGQSVHPLEGLGVLFAFAGCVLCSMDEAKEGSNIEKNGAQAIMGDFMALGSGALGVGYLTFAKAVRSELPVSVFMFMVMACGSILVLLTMLVLGETLTVNNNPYNGLFGWANLMHHRLPIILHVAVVCNVVGTMGFVRAMQFFDNIIIAVATLLEPMTATIIAFLVGVGSLPGLLGWTGNALVVAGTLAVVYPSVDKPLAH